MWLGILQLLRDPIFYSLAISYLRSPRLRIVPAEQENDRVGLLGSLHRLCGPRALWQKVEESQHHLFRLKNFNHMNFRLTWNL